MLARIETGRKKAGEESAGRLLNDLETISRALCTDKPLLKASFAGASTAFRSTAKTTPPKSKGKNGGGVGGDDVAQKDKKSIWNWKPLKALSSARNKKFRCSFSLQVHSIENLPYRFENTSVCVHWKKRDGEAVTRPSKVHNRAVEFDDILTHECIVHGNRSGPQHSAKYDAKHFLLFPSVLGAKDLDLGKHRIDLTRLLPLTLEELEDEKSSGNWTTTYRLSGDAKGATMNVSFTYTVSSDSPAPYGSRRVGDDRGIINHTYLKPERPVLKSSPGDIRSRVRRRSLEPLKSVKLANDLNEIESSCTLDDVMYPRKVMTSSSFVHGKDLSEMLSALSSKSGHDLNEMVGSASIVERESGPNEVMFPSTLLHENRRTEMILTSSFEHKNGATDSARSSRFEGDYDMNEVMLASNFDDEDGANELILPSNLEDDIEPIEVISTFGPDVEVSASAFEHEVMSSSMNDSTCQIDTMDSGVYEESPVTLIDYQLECDAPFNQSEPRELQTYLTSEPDLDDIEDCCTDVGTSISEVECFPLNGECNDTTDTDGPAVLCRNQECESSVEDIGQYHEDGAACITGEVLINEVSAVSVDNVEFIDVGDSIQHFEGRAIDPMSKGFDAHIERISWKESVMEELDKALADLSKLEAEVVDSQEDVESITEGQTDGRTVRDFSPVFLEDDIDTVANDFLDMLGIGESPLDMHSEVEPESPRECLLRQFEEDSCFSIFDLEEQEIRQEYCGYEDATINDQSNFSDEFDLESILKAVEEEHEMETYTTPCKLSARTMEDLESEALMREWGLNDNSFQSSPPKASSCDPSFPSPDEPDNLPPLGEGLGSFMQTKDGGFLRSMSPKNFRNAKSGGSLIMQVSSPVVVPAEMGSDVMDILQGLGSIGVEKLSMQANKLMPLEDITGKTMQQVGWEAGALEALDSECLSLGTVETSRVNAIEPKRSSGRSSAVSPKRLSSEYVSLEEIAPLAMDKIEALSLEGLKIQSGMSSEDATSNINLKSIGELSALQGKDVEGTAGLQLMNSKESADEVDGLMGLSLTLDEWMRLDSGDLGDEDNISERTSKILAAHHANTLDSIRGSSKGDRRRTKGSGRKSGLLGDNFTVALLVQLRDPLRNYEPVGTPMLALVQVERVFAPPKPKLFYNVSGTKNVDDEEDDSDPKRKEQAKEEVQELLEEPVPQFQINEVHVAGIGNDPTVKKSWGTPTQQQSGSRWLLANGMGKSSNKQPPLKPKTTATSVAPLAAKPQPNNSLWSISSRIHAGKGTAWNQPGKHVRNPNLLLPSKRK